MINISNKVSWGVQDKLVSRLGNMGRVHVTSSTVLYTQSAITVKFS